MRLCSYVVVKDKGFVPNPFEGFCTCAHCTPNHMNLDLGEGDWILGNSSADRGPERRLIYAMRITQPPMDFNTYFNHPDFQVKKARGGTWQERCGDNIYYKENGEWKRGNAYHHLSKKNKQQDTTYPRLFISDHYFYFGEHAPVMPAEFRELLKIGRGCSYHEGKKVEDFVKWLEEKGKPPEPFLPWDREEESGADCVQTEKGAEISRLLGQGNSAGSSECGGPRVPKEMHPKPSPVVLNRGLVKRLC